MTLGIFGGGTVGGGIVEILEAKKDIFAEMTGKSLHVKKICVRNASKSRDFAVPEGCEVVTKYDEILNDESIDLVGEVMGGIEDAKDVNYEALSKGKSGGKVNKVLI